MNWSSAGSLSVGIDIMSASASGTASTKSKSVSVSRESNVPSVALLSGSDHTICFERVNRVVVEPEVLGEHGTRVLGESGRRPAHSDCGFVRPERRGCQSRTGLDLGEHG